MKILPRSISLENFDRIIKIYLFFSSSIYLFVILWRLYAYPLTKKLSLLFIVYGAVIILVNIGCIITKKIQSFRLILVIHCILSLGLYFMTYRIIGSVYLLLSIHLFQFLLFERPPICYIESILMFLLVGILFLGKIRNEHIFQQVETIAVFIVINLSIMISLNFMMYYRERMIAFQNGKTRLEKVLINMDKANKEYQNYLIQVESDSMNRERKRMTREIHDIVGHSMINNISLLEMIGQMIENREQPQKVISTVDTARENATDGLERIRDLLYRFRSEIKREVTGLLAIGQMVKVFRLATGMDVETEYGNCPNSFNETIDRVVCTMIEESLMNSFRHGKATKIRVNMQIVDGILQIGIQDNGIGAGIFSEGIGLLGMRERLESLGGGLLLDNSQLGFYVRGSIPIGE